MPVAPGVLSSPTGTADDVLLDLRLETIRSQCAGTRLELGSGTHDITAQTLFSNGDQVAGNPRSVVDYGTSGLEHTYVWYAHAPPVDGAIAIATSNLESAVVVGSDVVVAAAWTPGVGSPPAPAVGDPICLWHLSGGVHTVVAYDYDICALGVAAIGTADITAGALYGGGGTLNGLTLILNVNGAGADTLTLNGATNTATEAAFLAAILAKWPALWQCVAGGTSANKLVLAAASITIGAGTANTALGLTAGAVNSTHTAVRVDRPIVWAMVLGDELECWSDASGYVRALTFNMRRAKQVGPCGQVFEFTHCQGVTVENVRYALGESSAVVVDSHTIGFDVGCRDCHARNYHVRGNAITRIDGGGYIQSGDRCSFEDTSCEHGGAGFTIYDAHESGMVRVHTANCQYGQQFLAFTVGDTLGGNQNCYSTDCADVGSNTGLMLRDSRGLSIKGWRSQKNSNTGIWVSSGCKRTSLSDVQILDAGVQGIYIEAGSEDTAVANSITSGSASGIIAATNVVVNGWVHRGTTLAQKFGTFNSDTKISNAYLTNTAAAAGLVSDASTVPWSIKDSTITVHSTAGVAISASTARTIYLENVTITAGYAVSLLGGASLVIGPGCDFSGVPWGQVVAVTGPSTLANVRVQQTTGVAAVTLTSGTRGLTWAQMTCTAIDVDGDNGGNNCTVYASQGIPGLQWTVTNSQSGGGSLTFKVYSEGGSGVVVAQGKSATIKVNGAGQCVRVTADT